jgi:heme-binding NEAT domain protein
VLPLKQSADFDISNIDYLGLSVGATTLERALGITLDSFRLSDDQAVLAEKAYKEAEKINERIEELPEITEKNYTTIRAKVRAIRDAYEELGEMSKSFIDAEMLAKLEAAEAAIAAFVEPPVVDEPDEPTQPTEPTTPTQPTTPEKPDGGNGTLIIIIAVVAVVVIAGVVVLLVLKKKKA